MWITSTMMDNEWNEDCAERKFIQSNFDTADCGVKMHRIFLYEKEYIQSYLSSNKIITSFVDINKLREKHIELLKVIKER